jgi:translation initiation factor 1
MPTKPDRKIVYSTGPEGSGSVSRHPSPRLPTGKAPPDPAGPWPSVQGNETVRVQRERKGRGGKTVSIITGIKSPEAGQRALLKQLKTTLGTGGTLEEGALVIQGDHRERIVEILRELGFNAKVAGG